MVTASGAGRETETREMRQKCHATATSREALFRSYTCTSPERQADVARAGKKPASKHMSAQAAAGAGAKRRGPSGAAAAGLLACGVVATAAACGMRRSRACGGVFATPPRSTGVGAAAPPPPREESGDASVSGSHPHPSRAHLPRTVAQVPPAPVASLPARRGERGRRPPRDRGVRRRCAHPPAQHTCALHPCSPAAPAPHTS